MPINIDLWLQIFIADLIIVGMVATFAFYSYYKRLSELKKVQSDSYKKAQEIMEEAKIQSQKIIENAGLKANEILTHSELFKSDLNKTFNDSLKKLADTYIQMVDEHSKKFIADYENILTSVKNQSLAKSGQALDNIQENIRRQLDESKTDLKAGMSKALEKAVAEIDQFRIRELAKVDQEIDQLVIQLAKDLLRINLTPKDHKKLVIQSLEKAKEQGAFFL